MLSLVYRCMRVTLDAPIEPATVIDATTDRRPSENDLAQTYRDPSGRAWRRCIQVPST